MLIIIRTIGLVVTLSIASTVSAQAMETGFLDRLIILEGNEYRYQVYVPRDYEASTDWPVIVALHGGGARGADGLRQTDVGLGRAVRRDANRFPAIIVFPQSPVEGPGWQDLGGRIAIAALNQTLEDFSTDDSRTYLIGHSAGGNGAWYLSYHHPELFAAVLVVCGFIEEHRGNTSGAFYPAISPSSSPDAFDTVAQRLTGIPIWIFHSDADPAISVEQSRQMAIALQALDANVQYSELPGVGHNAWDTAYYRDDVTTWLFNQ